MPGVADHMECRTRTDAAAHAPSLVHGTDGVVRTVEDEGWNATERRTRPQQVECRRDEEAVRLERRLEKREGVLGPP